VGLIVLGVRVEVSDKQRLCSVEATGSRENPNLVETWSRLG
jgi:hypothetical protein